MEFLRNDKVVNVKTGEFGVFQKMQEVVTASGETHVLFEVVSEDEAAGVLIYAEAGGYSARWNGEPYNITVFDQGLLLAPDRDFWLAVKNWCASFCELPV